MTGASPARRRARSTGASPAPEDYGPCDFDEVAVDVGGLVGAAVFGRGGGVGVDGAPAVPPLALARA